MTLFQRLNHDSEHLLLIAIARRELDEKVRSRLLGLLVKELDWNYVLAAAREHGLTNLLHEHLQNYVDAVPISVITKARNEAVANAQSVLLLTAKLLEVNKLFAEHNIPMAAFKGPVLSQIAFGELGIRRAGDIDILIEPRHFFRAKEILERDGYRMEPPLKPAQLRSHHHFHCETQFIKDDGFTIIDLHWELAPQTFIFKLTAGEVMGRLQRVVLGNATLSTFGPEDLLLYQAMHGAKHLWRRLEWIASFAALVSTDLDWEVVLRRAHKASGIRMLGLGLRLAEEFFEAVLPAKVLSAVDKDGTMAGLAQQVRRDIFVSHAARPRSTETNLYNFRIMDHKRDAFVSVMRALLLPTESDWQACSLPASLNSLYYVYRPYRLTRDYTTSLYKRLVN